MEGAAGGHGNDHAPRLDHRKGAVLELPARITLGVEVRDLLELERSLKRGRIAGMAPKEEEVGGMADSGSHGRNLV